MTIKEKLDNMLTVREVAQALHIHPNTLRRWCDQGKLATYIITPRGDRRFRQSDITRFIHDYNPYKSNVGRVTPPLNTPDDSGDISGLKRYVKIGNSE